jgi:hypothetical protein
MVFISAAGMPQHAGLNRSIKRTLPKTVLHVPVDFFSSYFTISGVHLKHRCQQTPKLYSGTAVWRFIRTQ